MTLATPTPIARVKEQVELYLHPPLGLHARVRVDVTPTFRGLCAVQFVSSPMYELASFLVAERAY